jgi:hypothetical protein
VLFIVVGNDISFPFATVTRLFFRYVRINETWGVFAMTKREVLEASTFGKRIAEEETEPLSSYFVKTEQWKRLLSGEVDVVYGPKGSGKSALYALLAREFDKLRLEKRIVAIPAENPRGTPAFRDLVDDPPASEEVFRRLWKFYLLSLLANYVRLHMKSRGVHDKEAEETIEILVDVGLLHNEGYGSLKGMLKRALDFVRSRPISLEGGLHPDASGGLELGGKITFGEPSNSERQLGVISSDDAFQKLTGLLRRQNITVWLMLDRLDVAFTENTTLEKHALRALFRTYLDLIAFDRIAIKIFLRDDIWRRIVAEGFREASHITRSLTIVWDAKSLQNLIIRRALYNSSIREFYSVNADEILSNAEQQSKFFYQLFPDQIAVGANKTKTLDWMLSRVADGSKNPAPREIIHLLQVSRDNQLRSYELGGEEISGNVLIGRAAIKDSLSEVSKVRFEQTLCAEYPILRSLWLKMENSKTAYTLESFSRLLEVSEEQGPPIAEQMVEAGFFTKKIEKGVLIYWVPFIYRDALHLVQGAATAKEE